MRDSIIGEMAVIGEGSTIENGSLVGARTKIGTGALLAGVRVGAERPEVEGEPEGATREFAVTFLRAILTNDVVGEGHAAFFWPEEEAVADSDDSDDEEGFDSRNLEITRLGAQFDSFETSSSTSSLSSLSRNSSTTSLSTTASHSASTYEPRTIAGLASLAPASAQNDFISECHQSLDRSFAEGHTVDNASIELKTLRMASNVPLDKVREVVIPFILKRCVDSNGVAVIIARWGGLISSLIAGQEEAMVDSLYSVQKFVVGQQGGDKRFFLRTVKGFYEEDVVSEEAVFAWYKSKEAREGAGELALWNSAKPFVEALAEDDSESE